jgi:hypothetical protein
VEQRRCLGSATQRGRTVAAARRDPRVRDRPQPHGPPFPARSPNPPRDCERQLPALRRQPRDRLSLNADEPCQLPHCSTKGSLRRKAPVTSDSESEVVESLWSATSTPPRTRRSPWRPRDTPGRAWPPVTPGRPPTPFTIISMASGQRGGPAGGAGSGAAPVASGPGAPSRGQVRGAVGGGNDAEHLVQGRRPLVEADGRAGHIEPPDPGASAAD